MGPSLPDPTGAVPLDAADMRDSRSSDTLIAQSSKKSCGRPCSLRLGHLATPQQRGDNGTSIPCFPV